MEHFILGIGNNFTAYAEMYGYIGIFFWFLIIDELVPLPDEIPLVTVGYLCALGVFRFPLLAGLSAFIPFMLVDAVTFVLARKGSRLTDKLEKKLNYGWLTTYKEKIRNHLPKTLLILAFIPRMRVFGPILAGAVKVPARRFFTFDAVSLGLFVAVYVSLGYFFHAGILKIFDELGREKHLLFVGLLILILFVLAVVNNAVGKRMKLQDVKAKNLL